MYGQQKKSLQPLSCALNRRHTKNGSQMNEKKKTKESKKPEKDFVEVKREKKEDFEAIKTKRNV